MRAVRYHEGGDVHVLQVESIPRPTPEDEEVLIEIRAASINPADPKRQARGEPYAGFPKTVGADFAGVVVEVGSAVTEFAVGDRVFGTGLQRYRQGSFADFANAPAHICTTLPESVSFADGAAIATVGATAWRAAVDYGAVQPTESVLIHGGSGGVGHIAVQLAKEMGGFVVSTAGSEPAMQAVREFGADVVFDYNRDDLFEAVDGVVDDGVDVVLDSHVGVYAQFDVDIAAFNGRIVCFGDYQYELSDPLLARKKELTVQWQSMSNTIRHDDLPPIRPILASLARLLDEGRLTVNIARTYGFDDVKEMHRDVLDDHFVGKLVMDPAL